MLRYFWCGLVFCALFAVPGFAQDLPEDGDAALVETEEPRTQKIATLLEIPLPITWSSVRPVYRSLQNIVEKMNEERRNGKNDSPILILCFRVPPNQETFGRGSQFGACFELAHFLASEEFQHIRTVAYFPQSVEGHAMLVALSAGELIVGDSVDFGNAGIDEKRITPAMRQAYLDVGRRFPEQIVLKMLDPALELWEAETTEGILWTDQQGIQKYREAGTLVQEPEKPLIPAGTPGLFSATQARQPLGIVDYLTNSREGEISLAQGLGIKPDQISFAKPYSDTGRAVRIDLNGPITTAKVNEVERQIRKATEESTSFLAAATGQTTEGEPPADFICLWIDSSGGSLADSLNLANFLAHDLDPMKVRTVAYVPHFARSDAAIIALACQEVVVGPGAIFGGSGEKVFSETEIRDAVNTISDSLAKKTFRRWSLPAAIIDPQLHVYKTVRKSDPRVIEYFCDRELEMQGDKDDWEQKERVSKKDTPFVVIGKEALDYYLADKVATDFNEFKLFYHLENDPTLLAPSWADQLIRALASPYLSVLLLMIGFFSLFAEIKTPGIGLGAFVAITCFVLFFWSRYLGGTAGWLEVSLFLTGVLFIVMEIFVIPGFGLFGIGGGAAIIASLVLASQTFIIPRNAYQFERFQSSLIVLIVSLVGMLAIAGVLMRWLHELNKPKENEFIRESEKLIEYSHLLGVHGIAATPLVPAGKGNFGNESINVVSDCELIEAGTPIQVVDVRGYRVLVSRVCPEQE